MPKRKTVEAEAKDQLVVQAAVPTSGHSHQDKKVTLSGQYHAESELASSVTTLLQADEAEVLDDEEEEEQEENPFSDAVLMFNTACELLDSNVNNANTEKEIKLLFRCCIKTLYETLPPPLIKVDQHTDEELYAIEGRLDEPPAQVMARARVSLGRLIEWCSPEQALTHYQHAAQLDQQYAEAFLQLGISYIYSAL